MHVGEAEIARQLRIVLAAIRSGAGNSVKRIALSALAEGSDRLFADTALGLGYRLEVLLPFSSSDYETTFSDEASTPYYRELLCSAGKITQLNGSLNDTAAAYEAVGQAMVDRSDIIVCVWDGREAAGRGGTPEIIEYAVNADRRILWIDAARTRLPRLICRSKRYNGPILNLGVLARRARRLTRRKIVDLVAAAVA